MNQVRHIQQELLAIDTTTFELLSGAFLYYQSELPLPPVPSGKAVAKNRPQKGNPDGYYFDGTHYHFLACTAFNGKGKRAALVKKIKEDIQKSLDKKKTDIDPGEIAAIHVCLADDLTAAEDQQVRKGFKKYSSLLKIWSGHQISYLIYNQHPELAEQYLGIKIGRKVILPLREYLHKIGSAPESLLVNPYVKPENFPTIEEKFQNCKILLISGSSGTGKTRLAIELLSKYISEDNTRRAYCIRSNAAPSSETIALDLSPGSQNNLLIDDAGREAANLLRILQHWQINNQYIDKLILTTRDYTRKAVESVLAGFSTPFETFELQHSSKHFLKEIIEKQGITDNGIIDKLITISRGRVRMAIMGAETVKNSNFNAELNAEIIYENFFKSIVQDKPELNNKNAQKFLAVLYFFKYIDFEDPQSVENRLKRFNLDETNMKETARILKDAEFLDGLENIYRVGDQEIGFYHFFRIFIKENILPLDKLLTRNELQYTHQLNETIGQSFRIFEGSSSLDRIRFLLEVTYVNISDNDLRFDFLEVFGDQFPDFAFEHTQSVVYSIPKPVQEPTFIAGDFTKYIPFWDRSKVCRYLKLVIEKASSPIDAYLDLYLELVRRDSKYFDDCLHFIYERLSWNEKDRNGKYARQKSMLNIFERYVSNEDPLAIVIVSAISLNWITSAYPEACQYFYEGSQGFIRKDPNHEEVRERIWKLLTPLLGKTIEPYRFIRDYVNSFDTGEIFYYSVDSNYIKNIIIQYLSPKILQHGIVVNELSRKIKNDVWLNENKIPFLTPDVLLGEALSLRTQQKYTEKTGEESQSAYDKRLLISISPYIQGQSLSAGFIRIYKIAEVIIEEKKNDQNNHFIYSRLGALLELISKTNCKEYFLCIEYIVKSKNPLDFLCRRSGTARVFKKEKAIGLKLHKLLAKSDYRSKSQILMNYYSELPKLLLRKEHSAALLTFFANRNSAIYIDLTELEKFKRYVPDLEVLVATMSLKRYREGNGQIYMSHKQQKQIIETLAKLDQGLAEEFYQMLATGPVFHDREGELLFLLAQKRPRFIVELISAYFDKQINIQNDIGIDASLFTSTIVDAESIVHELLDAFVEKQFPSDDLIRLIFGHMHKDSTEYKTAFEMLLTYIKKNARASEKMRKIMRIITKSFYSNWLDVIEKMLSNGLSVSQLEVFSYSNTDVYSGGVIISDLRKGHLEAILNRIIKSDFRLDNPTRFQECSNELHKLIRRAQRSARDERRREFIGSMW